MHSGKSTYDGDKWTSFKTTTYDRKPMSAIFTKSAMQDDLNPANIKVRESLDSKECPNSLPFIIGADITGSTNRINYDFVTDRIGKIFDAVQNRAGIANPHFMAMGVGDVLYDKAPLQVTQFEADPVVLAPQIQQIYIENGGGSNLSESYNLPWLFAAFKVKSDAYEKRGQKGFLFTTGDELPPGDLTAKQINQVFGNHQGGDISNAQLLDMVRKMFHVFHISITENTSYMGDRTDTAWRKLLGQNYVTIGDYRLMDEVIAGIVATTLDQETHIINTFNPSTATAIAHLRANVPVNTTSTGGLVRF